MQISKCRGQSTIDHGTSRFATTVSTRKLTGAVCGWFACGLFCEVASTSPAPRPGGAWLQPLNGSPTRTINTGEPRKRLGRGNIFVWFSLVFVCFRGSLSSAYRDGPKCPPSRVAFKRADTQVRPYIYLAQCCMYSCSSLISSPCSPSSTRIRSRIDNIPTQRSPSTTGR